MYNNFTILKAHTFIFFLIYALSATPNIQAQTYAGTIDHDGIYSFDYTIECGTPANTALVTVEYTTAEPPGVVPQLNLGGGSFVNMAGPSPFTYTLSGLTNCDFSFEFYIAWAAGGLYQSPAPLTQATLPIELLKFDARKNTNGSVHIDWLTASEINSDHFLIQRSLSGQEWEAIGRVSAAGNSTAINSYNYVDDAPAYSTDGYAYYRLEMVDFDGSSEYSSIRVIEKSEKDKIGVRLYPNPTISDINIDFSQIDWSLGALNLKIYNIHGQEVYTKTFMHSNKHKIDLLRLAASIYVFRFTQGGRLIFQSKVALN